MLLAKMDTHPGVLLKVWRPRLTATASLGTWLESIPQCHLWVNTPSGATNVPNQVEDGLPQGGSISPHPADTGPAAGAPRELGGLPQSPPLSPASTRETTEVRSHLLPAFVLGPSLELFPSCPGTQRVRRALRTLTHCSRGQGNGAQDPPHVHLKVTQPSWG